MQSLSFYPRDGTFLQGGQTGQIYRVAGGASVYAGTEASFGGPQPTIAIDQSGLDTRGSGRDSLTALARLILLDTLNWKVADVLPDLAFAEMANDFGGLLPRGDGVSCCHNVLYDDT